MQLSLKSDKTQIAIYVAITFAVSWSIQYLMIRGRGINDIGLDLLLMWTPGLVAICLSIFVFRNFKDIGFRFGQLKYYGMAYAIPAATACLILLTLIALGQGEFEVNPALIQKKGSLAKALIAILIKGPLLGVVMGSLSALGEEIGWRGFLQSRFINLKARHSFLIVGVIWAIWHWPLILFSNYATSAIPALSLFIFSIVTASFGIIIGYLRFRSGSVFVPMLAHGVHNMWIQAIYPAFLKPGPLDAYLGGESGIINAVIYLLAALFIYKKFLKDGLPKEI